jgi:aminoglycoside phosphotransferase (APT) family kinase protein
VLSHGDFTIDQLLVAGDGSVVVTDVDNACQAPAALDVAAFAANLVSGRDGDAEHAEAVLAALADSHGWPPALRWHFAVAVLRRCDRPFRRWKKGWPEKSEAILDLVEKVTASRS